MEPTIRDPRGKSRAMVLGGGGVTGIAWTTGLLLGLEEGGLDTMSPDLIIGTSAGATVGAQITSGVPLPDLFERQVDPDRQVAELVPEVSYLRLFVRFIPALMARRNETTFRRRIGRVALRSGTVEAESRRRVIAERLPNHEWPEIPLCLLAIDAVSGEERCFDRESGVDLVAAVAASCALPGVWPAVCIEGRDYIDGGIASPENSAHAAEYASALIISPMGGSKSGSPNKRIQREVAALERTGTRVSLLVPNAQSRLAMGRNALHPARRSAAARAGRNQGTQEAGRLRSNWL